MNGDKEQDEAIAISDDRYRSPTASVNSLAMVAEIVVPGENNECRDAVGVADDKGHGHGFAEGAAQRQHRCRR